MSVTERATCVVGVDGNWIEEDVARLRGQVRIVIEAGGVRQKLNAEVSHAPSVDSLVVRCGNDLAERTFAFGADTAASDLDRDLVRWLQDPTTLVTVTIEEQVGTVDGCLFVVGLPIGNTDDLTFRARRVLSQADVVLAQDPRRFRKLARDLGIRYQTVERFDAATEATGVSTVIARLRAGTRIALVSDTGTPLICDPGAALVRAVADTGIRVRPVPGPSAGLTAVMSAGLAANPLLSIGFLPRRSEPRLRLLREAAATSVTIVFFETPTRLRRSLSDVAEEIPGRELVIARELTKIHEEIIRTTTSSALDDLATREPRGEYTLVVGPPDEAAFEPPEVNVALLRFVEQLRDNVSTKDLAVALSYTLGISRRAAYDLVVSL